MKTLKALFSLFAIVAVFSSGAFAQVGNTDDDDVNVEATVVQDVSITNVADLDFGEILQGLTATVDPTGASHNNLFGSPTVGQLTISGANSAEVIVTFDDDARDLGDGDGNTIPYTPALAGHASTQGNATSISDEGTITLDGSGDFIVWVGGSIATGSVPGVFTSDATNGDGDLTITVQYE